MKLGHWAELVHRHFAFVEDHGFRPVDRFARNTFWALSVVYGSASSAIRVTCSTEFRRAEVELLRLRKGELPEPAVFYDDAQPFDASLLDNVVEARAPERLGSTKMTGLGKDELESQLCMWATMLREIAADFLAGSGAALDDAQRIVRARVEQEPQQITVWLPSGASAEEEAETVRKARATTPPSVEVVARRYKR